MRFTTGLGERHLCDCVKVSETVGTDLHLGHLISGHPTQVLGISGQRVIAVVVYYAVMDNPFDVGQEGSLRTVFMVLDLLLDGRQVHRAVDQLVVVGEHNVRDRSVESGVSRLANGLQRELEQFGHLFDRELSQSPLRAVCRLHRSVGAVVVGRGGRQLLQVVLVSGNVFALDASPRLEALSAVSGVCTV